jgi:hypothetical protein
MAVTVPLSSKYEKLGTYEETRHSCVWKPCASL